MHTNKMCVRIFFALPSGSVTNRNFTTVKTTHYNILRVLLMHACATSHLFDNVPYANCDLSISTDRTVLKCNVYITQHFTAVKIPTVLIKLRTRTAKPVLFYTRTYRCQTFASLQVTRVSKHISRRWKWIIIAAQL